MLYQEYKPTPTLLPYIETYWLADGYSETKEKYKILSDGCVDIIFSFNDTPNNNPLYPIYPI